MHNMYICVICMFVCPLWYVPGCPSSFVCIWLFALPVITLMLCSGNTHQVTVAELVVMRNQVAPLKLLKEFGQQFDTVNDYLGHTLLMLALR